jgi:hypothetical protein
MKLQPVRLKLNPDHYPLPEYDEVPALGQALINLLTVDLALWREATLTRDQRGSFGVLTNGYKIPQRFSGSLAQTLREGSFDLYRAPDEESDGFNPSAIIEIGNLMLNLFELAAEKNLYVALNHQPRRSEGAFRVLFDNGVRRGNGNNSIRANTLLEALKQGIVVLAEFPESLV